jgi:hypothetical protein
MPITDLDSYLPTLDEFIAHWSALNADRINRGQGEAVLRDGSTLQDLLRCREEFLRSLEQPDLSPTARKQSQQRLQLLRLERNCLQDEIRERLAEFRDAVSLQRPSARTAAWLRTFPSLDTREPRYLGHLDSVAQLWEALDNSAPLQLPDGYGLRDFQQDVQNFRCASHALRKAKREYNAFCFNWGESGGKGRARVMELLTLYRCAVRFELEVDREFQLTLPARTPYSYHPGQA